MGIAVMQGRPGVATSAEIRRARPRAPRHPSAQSEPRGGGRIHAGFGCDRGDETMRADAERPAGEAIRGSCPPAGRGKSMRTAIILLVALLCMPLAASAQMPDRGIPEVRPFAGALVPTGDNRDLVKDAVLAGVSAGFEVTENLHLVGTFAWSPSHEKLDLTRNRVDVYAYTVGAELQTPRGMPGERWLRPFVGLGMGGLTYHLRDISLNEKNYLTGYGSLGAELQMQKIGLRVEGRDYLHQFKGIEGNEKATVRNFMLFMAGLSFHIW
jgi:hypothetical protein